MSVRVASFNVENLFARYRFRDNFDPSAEDGFTANNLAFSLHNDDAKRITGQAICKVDADVICLQEVESLPVLERFNSQYLKRMKYKHNILVDSHDPRYIDVAVLSRYPFSYINTHRAERNSSNRAWLFSRDCLEVDVDINGKTLSLYVNHLKSMMGGRNKTKVRRREQANRVAEIVDSWWKVRKYEGNFIVAGDFNDYIDSNTSLDALVSHPGLVNVVDRLPEGERWTHYWAGGNTYGQLDYLLISKSLAAANGNAPGILRNGLPLRATRYAGARFNGTGENNPKASDHCPLYMDLKLS